MVYFQCNFKVQFKNSLLCVFSVIFFMNLSLFLPTNYLVHMKYNHILFYCTLFSCTSSILWFLQIVGCGNPVLSEAVGALFLMAFAHFCLWVTFWSSLRYFEHLHHCYICYGELQSMVVDVVIVSVLKGYELQPCTTTNLIDKYVCYDRSANGSHVSFSLKLLIFCDIIIFKSGQLITPQ